MIDSLLFLPDVVDLPADDPNVTDVRHAGFADAAFADDPGVTTARDDAEAAAAVAATRDGHAHAACEAWDDAAAALERSAAMRDRLVEAGLAGPVIAVRGWADVSSARVAAGDVDAARSAFARARTAAAGVDGLPADVAAAMRDLEAALGEAPAGTKAVADASSIPTTPALGVAADDLAGGLLWLDTTDEAANTATTHPAALDASAPAGAPVLVEAPTREPAAPARIAAIDDAVAIAHAGRAPGGLASRLRRLLRR
ncbi:hypothetical protein tb265_34480 [Gemmatimonadetes bacterium T265]|nr:hypothetical protein tb265_34480 [Gemmatimonadetes bacterium T265]